MSSYLRSLTASTENVHMSSQYPLADTQVSRTGVLHVFLVFSTLVCSLGFFSSNILKTASRASFAVLYSHGIHS